MKLLARGVEWSWPRRPLIMGIVNLSVDSFSGDGVADVDAAIGKARGLLADGADIIDVGAESARTNRGPISEEEEAAQLVRFIERWESPALLSLNTWRPAVARAVQRPRAPDPTANPRGRCSDSPLRNSLRRPGQCGRDLATAPQRRHGLLDRDDLRRVKSTEDTQRPRAGAATSPGERDDGTRVRPRLHAHHPHLARQRPGHAWRCRAVPVRKHAVRGAAVGHRLLVRPRGPRRRRCVAGAADEWARPHAQPRRCGR